MKELGGTRSVNREYTSEDITRILQKHRQYFNSGETRGINFRLQQLKRLKEVIKEKEEKLMQALYMDLGKPAFEAYATEVGYVLDSIDFVMKNLKRWAKPKRVKTPIVQPGASSKVIYEPYGTALIIGPYNYPFQLLIEPMIGAMAAGNCITLKPSEYTPHVAAEVEELIGESFDSKYISVVNGGVKTTAALINQPFDYIFFTGSVPVGKIVMEAAAKNLVPVTLELGGKSPCIVDKNANIEVSARRIAWGKFINCGQTCVAPDYLLVHKEIKVKFMDKLIETIKGFYGDKFIESTDYGRIVNLKHFDRLYGLIDKSKLLFGGEGDRDKLFISPTILNHVDWKDEVMKDEIFGPVLPIIEYESLEDIISKINEGPRPLALYIFSEDKKVQKELLEKVSFGGGCINDTISHVATPHMPFGGVGSSGIGAYHGVESFLTFSHKKSIMKKTTKFDIKLVYPPYGDKIKFLKRIMK